MKKVQGKELLLENKTGKVLWIKTNQRSYPVYFGSGNRVCIGSILQTQSWGQQVLVVTNQLVAQFYLEPVKTSLEQAGYRVQVVFVPDGEAYKTLNWVDNLCTAALDAGLDRHSVLVALGGGVIGDLAGFAAAIYMRGIPLVQIPTTLLAQVDSSVGGKVGVNHPKGKNLLGAFYQPNLVLIDSETLKTLPNREIRAGLAEVVKYGIIWDQDFFGYLEKNLDAILAMEHPVVEEVLVRCCWIKGKIVEADEHESGMRTLLNFGHTLGHAIEAQSKYQKFRHGEAIAVGMVLAGEIAQRLGWWTQEENQRLGQILQRIGLPVSLQGVDPQTLIQNMEYDKKNLAGRIRWVLPCRIGKAAVTAEVPPDLVQEILTEMTGNDR